MPANPCRAPTPVTKSQLTFAVFLPAVPEVMSRKFVLPRLAYIFVNSALLFVSLSILNGLRFTRVTRTPLAPSTPPLQRLSRRRARVVLLNGPFPQFPYSTV